MSFIQQLIDTHRLSPQSLVFEITESVAISDMASAQQLVKVLKEQGCRFSIDDFGSGFASFSYIKDFDFDYLKIDGSFVQGMQENELDKLVVDAACRLGHAVGAKVIAEFVDSEAIASALRALGVDYAQGYYFGRPIPLYEAIS
ncbi:MAG: EAL domain-containing protein [Gammaproteobacteria bacterium]|nr:MAG: EAL domain-containing protein [Gammaproteobacteria bacterium]